MKTTTYKISGKDLTKKLVTSQKSHKKDWNHRSQVRKILCDDVVGPYILGDTPHPPLFFSLDHKYQKSKFRNTIFDVFEVQKIISVLHFNL